MLLKQSKNLHHEHARFGNENYQGLENRRKKSMESRYRTKEEIARINLTQENRYRQRRT